MRERVHTCFCECACESVHMHARKCEGLRKCALAIIMARVHMYVVHGDDVSAQCGIHLPNNRSSRMC